MGSYQVDWKPSAEKDLHRIASVFIARIIQSVESLEQNPFPAQCKKLKGAERIYRLRVGDYRILYEVDTKRRHIVIHYVRHRRKAYRR